MDKSRIASLTQGFDSISHQEQQVEYWLARELQPMLGYKTWENFETAIKRAIDSVVSTDIEPLDHFREVTKMVQLGSGATRNIRAIPHRKVGAILPEVI